MLLDSAETSKFGGNKDSRNEIPLLCSNVPGHHSKQIRTHDLIQMVNGKQNFFPHQSFDYICRSHPEFVAAIVKFSGRRLLNPVLAVIRPFFILNQAVFIQQNFNQTVTALKKLLLSAE